MLNVGFFSGSRFVKKLIDYLKLNKQDVMGFRSFSSKDKLREYTLEKFSEKNVLDVFLCEDCDEYLRIFDNDESMDAVLSYVIFDNPREGVKNSSRKIKFISKFQSAEEIYVKIIDFLAENSEGIVFKNDNINISSKVSCFYVPGGYFEQDRLFFNLVKSKINNRNDIFVIDLNTFSLTANFLGMNGTRNSNDISQSSISDLIYFIRKKSSNLSLKLESVVKKINDYHYIGSVRDFRELDD
ncbi:MAG: hypothetical protein K6F77_06865 [Lachnospiraceae bacterium]|nr:hypothetical protein [Lachnospiraceae bacterium]